ncbi:hypothetical protein Cgig2_009347 [Carnegiea gigantea]|uniref:MULE transposase domain-containing protein n=1 Tax=Carnegiea gigantea TaxID=171969 RepID=A0A9Q1JFC3_9CARY|nr:hypothetical protein Cgig2_009347 [Carnegiea gigantea]
MPVCIGLAISAFKQHCRSFIGIDTCHLKGSYKGILTTAMGLDDNNGQYPLAYGVAPQEEKEELSFFLHGLATALDAREYSSKYTIMSGRHKILKVDDNTNNFAKSFNNTIIKHRGKPTYTMLEEIRKIIGLDLLKFNYNMLLPNQLQKQYTNHNSTSYIQDQSNMMTS